MSVFLSAHEYVAGLMKNIDKAWLAGAYSDSNVEYRLKMKVKKTYVIYSFIMKIINKYFNHN